MAEAELQLGDEIVGGEKALDAMPLNPIGIVDEDGRRPLGAEPFEGVLLFLDVKTRRDEVLRDQLFDSLFGVDLGIQPSATGSHRCRAEIQQQRLSRLLRLSQRRVRVANPVDCHTNLRRADASRRGAMTHCGDG